MCHHLLAPIYHVTHLKNPDTPAWAGSGSRQKRKKCRKVDFGGFGDPVTSVDLPYDEDSFPGYSVLSAMHFRIFVDLCDEYAIFSVKSERNTSESVCFAPSSARYSKGEIRYFRKTSPAVALTGKGFKNERIPLASRSFIF